MAVSSASIKINGQTYPLTYNSTTQKWEATLTAPGVTSFNEANHVFAVTATATNTAGTTGTGSTTLRVLEKVAPVITIVSPTNGAFVSNSQQPVVFTVADEANGSGIDLSSLTVTLDGTTVAAGTLNTTAVTNGYQVTYTPASAVTDGSHTITVDVDDNDGNSAVQKSTAFTVDTIPPVLNVTSPAEGSITANSSCVVAGSTNDATSSSVTVEVTLNGVSQGNAAVSGGGFSKTITLAEGSNTIVVTATDSAGKSSEVTRTVTLDTSVPVVGTISITPNPVDAGATMVITVEVS